MNDVEDTFKAGFIAGIKEAVLNFEAGPERFAEFLEEVGYSE